MKFTLKSFKVVLHTGLNVYRESSGGSWFVSWCVISCQKEDLLHGPILFPFNFLIPIQSNMHCWWVEINESSKYKPYYNIGDLSKSTFWYHSNDTKGNPWVMLRLHYPISDSFGCLHITVYLELCYKPLGILQRVTNRQKVHISSHGLL